MADDDSAPKDVDGQGKTIHIITARANKDVTARLADGVAKTVHGAAGVLRRHWVPTAMDLPFAAQSVISTNWQRGLVDAVVVIGSIGEGERDVHAAVAKGCVDVQLKAGVPVIFGVVSGGAVDFEQQPEDWAWAAMEMADFMPHLAAELHAAAAEAKKKAGGAKQQQQQGKQK